GRQHLVSRSARAGGPGSEGRHAAVALARQERPHPSGRRRHDLDRRAHRDAAGGHRPRRRLLRIGDRYVDQEPLLRPRAGLHRRPRHHGRLHRGVGALADVRPGAAHRMSRGYVLMEVTVAYVILAFAIVSLVPAFVLALKANKNTEQIQMATDLSQELMEEIRMRRWDQNTPFPRSTYIAAPT